MLTKTSDTSATVRPQYGFGIRLTRTTMERARAELGEALAAEGFGVVSEIDVRATLRKKLDVEMQPYLIIGVCDPGLARRVLEIEPYAGLALPCNITLWEERDAIVLTVASPKVMMSVLGDERLRALAVEAETRLRGALARLVV